MNAINKKTTRSFTERQAAQEQWACECLLWPQVVKMQRSALSMVKAMAEQVTDKELLTVL